MRNVLQASRRRAGGKGRRNGTFPRTNGRHPGCQEAGTTEKIIPEPEGIFVNESVVYIPMKVFWVFLFFFQSLGVRCHSRPEVTAIFKKWSSPMRHWVVKESSGTFMVFGC